MHYVAIFHKKFDLLSMSVCVCICSAVVVACACAKASCAIARFYKSKLASEARQARYLQHLVIAERSGKESEKRWRHLFDCILN